MKAPRCFHWLLAVSVGTCAWAEKAAYLVNPCRRPWRLYSESFSHDLKATVSKTGTDTVVSERIYPGFDVKTSFAIRRANGDVEYYKHYFDVSIILPPGCTLKLQPEGKSDRSGFADFHLIDADNQEPVRKSLPGVKATTGCLEFHHQPKGMKGQDAYWTTMGGLTSEDLGVTRKKVLTYPDTLQVPGDTWQDAKSKLTFTTFRDPDRGEPTKAPWEVKAGEMAVDPRQDLKAWEEVRSGSKKGQ